MKRRRAVADPAIRGTAAVREPEGKYIPTLKDGMIMRLAEITEDGSGDRDLIRADYDAEFDEASIVVPGDFVPGVGRAIQAFVAEHKPRSLRLDADSATRTAVEGLLAASYGRSPNRHAVEFLRYLPQDTGILNGRRFWSGAFDPLDGHIVEVHQYAEAEGAGMHHSMYFSERSVAKMERGSLQFFWIDRGKIESEWRNSGAEREILAAMMDQIRIEPLATS